MPAKLRSVVADWIEEGRISNPGSFEASINGRFLVGGPGGSSYLDAEGEIWDLFWYEEGFVRTEDGPQKLGIVVYAAKWFPALLSWLPTRPDNAKICNLCNEQGEVMLQSKPMQCWECFGLGWVI